MAFDPEKITFFAKTDARGKDTPFGIKAIDRQRHMYVIGKTGMGKSTLLENMAVQDIQSGEGMAFIDPHGATAETLLNYIPEERRDDVLYFAPFDMEHPISFNVMEDVGADKRHLVVSGLMSVFEKIWVDAWSARMAYILQNTLLALLEYPDSTLLGVNRMLSDKDYRNMVVDNIKDPGVKSFWVDEFAKYNERYMQEAGDAIKNKIGQFTSNPLIRNIVGQPKSSFDIRQMMDDQKIIIMNLSKGLVGESNANLLGSMLTTRIYLAAMSRADCSPEEMQQLPNFYFYVDEFQSFANATFANILSEARKYKLNLTMAHQYIEQMEEEVKNAVFGNVGTIVSFRVGPFDAEVLETIFNPQFYATDIVNLGFAQIYLTLMIDGVGSQPFSGMTLPPIAPAEISYKDCIIDSSRKNYSKHRAPVEESVIAFHEPVKKESARRSESSGGERPPRQSSGGNSGGERRSSGNGNGSKSSERRNGSSGGGNSSQKPSKNLDELRSVLASISKKQTEKEESGNKKKTEGKEKPKPEKPAPAKAAEVKEKGAEDLKAALASVLKAGAATAREASTAASSDIPTIPKPATAEKPKPTESTSPAPKTAKQPEATTSVPAPQPSTDSDIPRPAPVAESMPANVPARPDGPSDTVSAKEIERMMRVSENEKPPIRY